MQHRMHEKLSLDTRGSVEKHRGGTVPSERHDCRRRQMSLVYGVVNF